MRFFPRLFVVGFLCTLVFCKVWASPADKTFTITTETYLPFIGEGLLHQGWAMDVARAALEPQGYKVTLNLRPWARAMMESKLGLHDGLYLAYQTKEREEWYVFSDSIAKIKTGFFKLKTQPIEYRSLTDLQGYTIGLTRDASVSSDFDHADFLRKEPTINDIQSLNKLLLGRIDLFAGNQVVTQYLIDTHLGAKDRDRIEFMEPPLAINGLHMAISKKTPNFQQKLIDFNRGLKTIMEDGTYKAILQRHNLR